MFFLLFDATPLTETFEQVDRLPADQFLAAACVFALVVTLLVGVRCPRSSR